MAESAIVSASLKALFEKLASGAQQQLGNMLGVPRELEKLQSKLTTIQSVLQAAEEKEVKEKDAALRGWLDKLKNAAYDADDVLDEAHYELLRRRAGGIKNKVNDFFSPHNPLFFRAKMAGKVEDVVERLDAIAKERSDFHLGIDRAAAEESVFEWRQTYSCVDESVVIGRGEDKRRIIDMLLLSSHESSSSSSGGSHPRVLPIVGMGGLGKTTLAQMVYNDEEVIAHFELRMWVCVSIDFNFPRLVKEIILLGGGTVDDIDTASKEQLQLKLRKTLASKRYLLVLDDVWNKDPQKWGELRDLLTCGGEGSTIIVTTRDDIVAAIVGTINPYRLELLSEGGCWELFERKAFPRGIGNCPELVEIGKKIVKRCKGLPIAAKVIGSMMYLKKEKRDWLNVLESEVWDLEDDMVGILPVLKLSYHQLPPHLKRCFAFCAIFPKDHEINKEMLIQLWMANGLIPTGGRLELEEKGDCIFKELASRSFFQDIKEDTTSTTCKIYDLIHDLAQSIMGKECVVLNEEQLKRTSEGVIRYLVVADDTIFSVANDNAYKSWKSLRALLIKLNSNHNTKGIHVPNLVLLRVLDLHGLWISKLPISIDNLKHLRYLDLSENNFEILPEAICQLFHLQTLKIENCKQLRKLPKGMGKMCNLRHVYNKGCIELTSMPRGLHKLSNLQTLTMFVASQEAGSCGINELKDLDFGGELQLHQLENAMYGEDAEEAHLGSKTKIKSLVLTWGYSAPDNFAEEILEALQPHEGIQSLRIDSYRGQQTPSWLVRCHLLEKLVIKDCDWLTDIPPLPSLTLLEVTRCPHLCSTDKGFFTRMNSLELLVIDSADQLVLLLESEEDDDGDRNAWIAPLSVLLISNCEARMFSSSCLGVWKNLSALHTLLLYRCSGLIYLPDDLMCGPRSLKFLRIDSCNSLTGGGAAIRRRREEEEEGGLHLQHLTSLERLEIDGCEALTSVSLGEDLQQLRFVEISYCCKISKIFGLGGKTALCRLVIINTAARTIGLPSGLRTLSITGCPDLTTLLDEMGGLTLLEELQIYNCPLLATLPMGLQQRLPHLKFLYIRGCPHLETLPLPHLRSEASSE